MKSIAGTLPVCAGLLFAQSGEAPPKFEIADVHISQNAPWQNQFVRTGPVHDGRYDVRTATMVDLIRLAYGFDNDKIVGGPNWLELDRYDVSAKEPPETKADARKEMMKALLEERFKLKVHKDTQPAPAYVLTVGKKPQLKEAAEGEQAGCRPKVSSGPAPQGGVQLSTMGAEGQRQTFVLGPGMTIHYECRKMSMEEFAAGMRGMMGALQTSNGVVDETGLKGKWDFDLSYSLAFFGPMMAEQGERITISAALDKQLGLKLEEKPIPTPVLVVDSVERTPSPNSPGTAEALPPIALPTEFDVGAIKPTDPGTRMGGRFQIQPGGRFMAQGMNLQALLNRAFDTFNNEQIVGLPSGMAMDRYDIMAKLPPEFSWLSPRDMDAIAKPLLKLIVDRFQMKYHTEERQVTAYALTAGKPKLKKADAASRIYCRDQPAPPPAPPGNRMLKCQNISMAQFAGRLRNMAPGLNWPIQDSTGLEGGWDFSLTWSMNAGMQFMGGGRGGDAPGGAVPTAAEPSGALTIFEAMEKQLGLKLDKQKRTGTVYVIDHIEPKPSDN